MEVMPLVPGIAFRLGAGALAFTAFKACTEHHNLIKRLLLLHHYGLQMLDRQDTGNSAIYVCP